jgi:hypothetical protein
MIIKNNNIVMTSTDAYPIYLNSIANVNLYDMDYNNMYAPTFVGYAAANVTSINDWQQIITTDKHSTCVNPNFIDVSAHMELSDYTGLLCPFYPDVIKDIEDNFRMVTTTI